MAAKQASVKKPLAGGTIKGTRTERMALPREGAVHRFLLTCAQNNTRVHQAWWRNVLALRDHLGAELLVAPVTYNKASWNHNVREDEKAKAGTVWYDETVKPFLSVKRVQLAPGLVWCGEVDIWPTAERPLSSFELYCGRNSAIIGHAKIAMESVASGKTEGTKMLYTTGTVTTRNYIKKKAGFKGEMHHRYGCALVEVMEDGTWFVRQLEATEKGTAQDLDLLVEDGVVTAGNPIEGIGWWDMHPVHLEDNIVQLAWGEGGMLDELQPKYQFFHDIIDMHARNPWDMKNPLRMFERQVNRRESIRQELGISASVLAYSERPWCRSVVVKSNHDDWLERWVCMEDGRKDPVNSVLWWDLGSALWHAREKKNFAWLVSEHALKRIAGAPASVQFLTDDESFILCKDRDGGIECGMHGHLGPNGARGNPGRFRKMGRRANIGHMHSAGIYDGLYVGGAGAMDMLYNVGPSSWTRSAVITYPLGTRSIVTVYPDRAGKLHYRAS